MTLFPVSFSKYARRRGCYSQTGLWQANRFMNIDDPAGPRKGAQSRRGGLHGQKVRCYGKVFDTLFRSNPYFSDTLR
jgi:hypothetical protein